MRPRTRAMRFLIPLSVLVTVASGADPGDDAPVPGSRHRLTISEQYNLTYFPETRRIPETCDYQATVDYRVETRSIDQAEIKADGAVKKKVATSKPRTTRRTKGAKSAAKVAGAVDLSIHSSEFKARLGDKIEVQSRISRERFLGHLVPDVPFLNVSQREAPPDIQALLRTFDTTAASVQFDDRSQVVASRIRDMGPLQPMIETLVSIHSPIPKGVASWDRLAGLAIGWHGDIARGSLHFEKQKSDDKTEGLVMVKVSGTLEHWGLMQLKPMHEWVKMYEFQVTGEQTYDPRSREWRSSRWSVGIPNEWANPSGRSVQNVRAKIVIETRSLNAAPNNTESPERPKL